MIFLLGPKRRLSMSIIAPYLLLEWLHPPDKGCSRKTVSPFTEIEKGVPEDVFLGDEWYNRFVL